MYLHDPVLEDESTTRWKNGNISLHPMEGGGDDTLHVRNNLSLYDHVLEDESTPRWKNGNLSLTPSVMD